MHMVFLNIINFRVNIREYIIWITVIIITNSNWKLIWMPREKRTARMSTGAPRNVKLSAKFELDGYPILLGITKGIIFFYLTF